MYINRHFPFLAVLKSIIAVLCMDIMGATILTEIVLDATLMRTLFHVQNS